MSETNEKRGKNWEKKAPPSGEKIDTFSELMTEWLDEPATDNAIPNQTRHPNRQKKESDIENKNVEDAKDLEESDFQHLGNLENLETFAQELDIEDPQDTFETVDDEKMGAPIGEFEGSRIMLEMDSDAIKKVLIHELGHGLGIGH